MILLQYGYKSGEVLLAELDPEHYITNQKAVVSKLSGSAWNTPIVPIYSNESLELTEEEYEELTADWKRYQDFLANKQDPIEKADSYKPTAGMVTAAKRALRWKDEGKAKGAGTPVGWGRATDIAAGRSMSLDVVKRMFSFFSRHEVDKKGKDFDNISEPSNGRIMWDAWGGDAGFTWSRTITEREKKKLKKSKTAKTLPADVTIPIKYKLGKVLLGELTNGMFITKGKIPVYKNSLLSVSELDLLPYWGDEKIELTNEEYNEMTRSYFLLKRLDQ